jgi:hypothetical protein
MITLNLLAVIVINGRLGAEYLPQVSLAALPGNNMMMYE